jgi:hypothetical protein
MSIQQVSSSLYRSSVWTHQYLPIPEAIDQRLLFSSLIDPLLVKDRVYQVASSPEAHEGVVTFVGARIIFIGSMIEF